MFEVGDTVMIIDTECTKFVYGQIFTINEVIPDGFVTLKESDSWRHFSWLRFTLAPTLFKELV